MRNFRFLIALMFVSGFFFNSCSTDVPLPPVNGSWEAESFTFEGREQIPNLIARFTLKYKKITDQAGEFDWLWIHSDGRATVYSGDYELIEESNEIKLTFVDGTITYFDLSIENDQMDLNGNFKGTYWIIKAERD